MAVRKHQSTRRPSAVGNTSTGAVQLLSAALLTSALVAGCAAAAPETGVGTPPSSATTSGSGTKPTTPTAEPTEPPAETQDAEDNATPATANPKTPSADKPKKEPKATQALAIDVLNRLPVKGRAPRTGYARDHFGRG